MLTVQIPASQIGEKGLLYVQIEIKKQNILESEWLMDKQFLVPTSNICEQLFSITVLSLDDICWNFLSAYTEK